MSPETRAPSSPVQTLEDLRRRLDALPPPADGLVRVYRGQTRDFPKMVPSACRPGASPGGKIWDIALLGLRDDTLDLGPDPSVEEVIHNVGFWFKVLAQHYGPGSPFLDVTSSPEVALWFALNKAGGDPLGEAFHLARRGLRPVAIRCTALMFSPHVEVGWFYVLDVPPWDGDGIPGHGELVDLTRGPPFVTRCPRVRRQLGALVKADADADGGDLAGLYACPPIPVRRPVADTTFIDAEASHLFPGPDEDPWFDRLLRAPLIPRLATATGFEYRQSLDVYVIGGEGGSSDVSSVIDRQVERVRPLVRASTRAIPDLRASMRQLLGVEPERATYLQLEMPLLAHLPPPDRWNQSALAAGMDKRVRPVVEGEGEWLPAVTLENVILELSPLEYALQAPEVEDLLIGALWLVREGPDYRFVTIGVQSDPIAITHTTPIHVRYSDAAGCFELVRDGAYVPLLESGLPRSFTKAFFLALDVVRGLSGGVKPDAYLSLSTKGEEGEWRSLVPLRTVSTVLARAKADADDMRLHFLRYADTLQLYVGPTLETPAIGLLDVRSHDDYATMTSLRDIYGHVHELNLLQTGISVMPPRDGVGFSDAAADEVMRLLHPEERA